MGTVDPPDWDFYLDSGEADELQLVPGSGVQSFLSVCSPSTALIPSSVLLSLHQSVLPSSLLILSSSQTSCSSSLPPCFGMKLVSK